MRTKKFKKILILLTAVIMVFMATACNNATEPQAADATPTMAPENTEAEATVTEEAVTEEEATVDPLAGLKYWEIDPDKKIYNILLLGLDALEGTTWARNDTTMILQINLETNEMKLVSFMRDMIVDIPGHGEYRLNNAHYRGGPELAMQTMKSVFGVDIDYYAVVDFVSFTQVMRVIGTIKINVEEYEVAHLKKAESAVSVEGEQILGQGVVQNEGVHEFNEYLTLSYARDRHSSGPNNEKAGDNGRNARQREVIKASWTSVKSKSTALIPPSVFLAMPYVNSNMDEALIITLVNKMMEADAEITDLAMPAGSFWAAWKDDTGIYSNDEYKAIYAQKKADYEQANAPTPTQEGEQASAEPTEEVAAFPGFDSWTRDRGAASVIQWSSKAVYKLHDFLGID